MKLAAAFAERKDIKRKIQELQSLATSNVMIEYRKDEKKPEIENPMILMDEVVKLSERESALTVQINLANNRNGLMEKSNQRDMYRNLSQYYRSLVNSSRGIGRGYRQEDMLCECTIDVKEATKMADSYANTARKLDLEIQELDWTVEL